MFAIDRKSVFQAIPKGVGIDNPIKQALKMLINVPLYIVEDARKAPRDDNSVVEKRFSLQYGIPRGVTKQGMREALALIDAQGNVLSE